MGFARLFKGLQRPVQVDNIDAKVQRVIQRMPRRRGPQSKLWSDGELRRTAIEFALSDRSQTYDFMVAVFAERFGPDRAPSKAALCRFVRHIDALRVSGALD
ncbi:hypothetical protein SAMN05660686_04817 [Thalassobaculum litoreum DSM 18839]|uniref:Uncharacterized protein n=1 Tax=Thalassobaculum litoreum DSM 18839 TaxID=1123362 RepID=A0A8G2F5Q3_9PROT|nr:hypothetical protein SAMN05660686_04817 [Thalassobaculum litoreum DSM 18839]